MILSVDQEIKKKLNKINVSHTTLKVIAGENWSLCPVAELDQTLNELASRPAYFSDHMI